MVFIYMWGNILTEISYIQNFNAGFTNNKSDVLIHLSQWQYWWWFWFAFLWVIYYLLVARAFRYRTLKFNPRIASTLRPHGKWGDLLACIIPITWCLNILINSNFILKLIEWQSESSLFTLRVRAKQWYWVYKLDLRNIADVFSTPRNVGRNRWQFSTFGDLQTADDYLHIMQMRAYSNWSKDFWSELGKKVVKKNKFSINTPLDLYKNQLITNNKNSIIRHKVLTSNLHSVDFGNHLNTLMQNTKVNNTLFINGGLLTTNNVFKTNVGVYNIIQTTNKFDNDFFDKLSKQSFFKKTLTINNLRKTQPIVGDIRNNSSLVVESTLNHFEDLIFDKNIKNIIKHPDLDDETRIIKKNSGKNTPIRVLKQPKSDFFILNNNVDKTELFRLRFNERDAVIANKPIKPTTYLTFKQKRYNQRVGISKKQINFTDKETNSLSKYSGNPFLKNNSIIEENFGNPTRQYRMVKKAKLRLDTTRLTNWNRLLRSRRILVLPAHVNITVITNSFDLVHSWHIPGLGLKMDCLPGRATHHTLYIDNVGLYYGQCAEICGRYHHHMPVRICALPFEHFLVWWHTFGLPKFLFPSNKNKLDIPTNKYFSRKFSW